MENASNIDRDFLETAILDYIYMEHHSTLHPFHHNFIDKSQRHWQLQNISQYEQRILPPCEERLTSAKEQVTYQHNRQSEAEGCMIDRNSMRHPLTDFNRNESSSNGDFPFQVPSSQSENTLHFCDICNKTFARKYNLKLHKKIHTGERPHVCEVCRASFNRKDVLEVHERIHTGERPFVCKVCDASFKDKSHLVRHERIHTGERPFVCKVCDASFKDNSNLARHEQIHTETRYYCRKCSKSFSQNSNKQAHEKKCRNGE